MILVFIPVGNLFAVNEKGLGMAGLNFVGNAAYKASVCGEKDVAQFEFIPWILSQCATVSEARAKLDGINLTGTPFGSQLPAAQLHWIIAEALRKSGRMKKKKTIIKKEETE